MHLAPCLAEGRNDLRGHRGPFVIPEEAPGKYLILVGIYLLKVFKLGPTKIMEVELGTNARTIALDLDYQNFKNMYTGCKLQDIVKS